MGQRAGEAVTSNETDVVNNVVMVLWFPIVKAIKCDFPNVWRIELMHNLKSSLTCQSQRYLQHTLTADMEESHLEQKTTQCPLLKLCCIWDVNQPRKYCRFIKKKTKKHSTDKVFIFFIFYLNVDVKLEAQQSRRRLGYVWWNRSKFSWMWCLWRFFFYTLVACFFAQLIPTKKKYCS